MSTKASAGPVTGRDRRAGGGTNNMTETRLTPRQQQILKFIDQQIGNRGYPPSVREIGEAVGLTSPSTVHSHLATLQDRGFIRRDPSKPRALEVCLDPLTGAAVERGAVRHVPLVGDVAAGTGVMAEMNVEESLPLPAEFTGDGELFMLRVRGDSMVDAGILDGDHVVARVQPTADRGDLVVAGIDDEEATVKSFDRDGDVVILNPANGAHEPIHRPSSEVRIYGRVVTVLRRI